MIRHSILALAIAATAAGGALAASPETASRRVVYADLDLSRPADVARLRHRVARALEATCGAYAGSTHVADEDESDRIGRCRADARANVAPMLAMLIRQDGPQLAGR